MRLYYLHKCHVYVKRITWSNDSATAGNVKLHVTTNDCVLLLCIYRLWGVYRNTIPIRPTTSGLTTCHRWIIGSSRAYHGSSIAYSRKRRKCILCVGSFPLKKFLKKAWWPGLWATVFQRTVVFTAKHTRRQRGNGRVSLRDPLCIPKSITAPPPPPSAPTTTTVHPFSSCA